MLANCPLSLRVFGFSRVAAVGGDHLTSGWPETGGAAGAACAVPTLRGPLSLLGAGAPPAGWSPGLRPLPDLGVAAVPTQVPQPPALLRRLPTAQRLAEEGGALPGELRSPRLFRRAENPVLVPTEALEN